MIVIALIIAGLVVVLAALWVISEHEAPIEVDDDWSKFTAGGWRW